MQSNQIAQATINYNPQSGNLIEIVGTYYQTDKDGNIERKRQARFGSFHHEGPAHGKDAGRFVAASDKMEVSETNPMLLNMIWTIAPFLLIGILFWFFFIRQIKMAGKGALSFGKSKARMLAKERNKTMFKDVAGH